jgi:hypothetical protein
MYFVKIFFCLFCKFRGSKPTRTRTQNREKQRSGLSSINKYNKERSIHIDIEPGTKGGGGMVTPLTEFFCQNWFSVTLHEVLVIVAWKL